MKTLFLLIVGHFMADYGLQTSYIALNKGKSAYILLAHSMIHGFFVFYATQSVELGVGEVFLHYGIDFLKGKGKLTDTQDQLLHMICKLVWFLVSTF
jgi:hypothetical protein